MVPRYTPPQMGLIWAEEARFQKMLEVELLACEALCKLGRIPRPALKRIQKRARLSVSQISKREGKTKHDVVAFLEEIGSHLGKDACYLHIGLTSSDALDTGTAVQISEASNLILKDLEKLRRVVGAQAKRFQDTVCMGRTHGIHAEPTTFGLKLAVHYAELGRGLEMLTQAKQAAAVGKISGAVGTYAHLNPFVERYICKKLKINPAPISTQVVPRDGIAVLICRMAIVGGMLERMATEIRHLQRTEVLEVEEPFGKGQTGSSAMPHKRNPIATERVTGLSRLLRGYAANSLENIALWHERDISHSSVERVILPDAFCALDFMIREMAKVLEGMSVYPKNMQANLERTRGLIFSESVLLKLMEKGLTRKGAYKIVQRNALRAWKSKETFLELLSVDEEVGQLLSKRELMSCFDVKRHTRHVKTIFRRIGLSHGRGH